MKQYYVYIMASESGTLYTGVTSRLAERVALHKAGMGSKFTARYDITKLVYYEVTNEVESAIAREKQIKGYGRAKKEALIRAINPCWRDLMEDG